MKIVFSRKGFDQESGATASPIMPDGAPVSLPIPRNRGRTYSYDDLFFNDRSLSSIIRELKRGRFTIEDHAHADPDLDEGRLPRKQGWRPVFGQTGNDQSHLEYEGVGVGDLFLFYGWFRHAETSAGGSLRYVRPRRDLHVIFGWLQVGEVLPISGRSAEGLPEWLREHPHVATPDAFDLNNTVYVAADRLTLGGNALPFPGGGTFSRFAPALSLTWNDSPNRSLWDLPRWFHPGPDKPPLSRHEAPWRWSFDEHRTILQSVPRGQEFVLDAQHYPEALDWIRALFDATHEPGGTAAPQ